MNIVFSFLKKVLRIRKPYWKEVATNVKQADTHFCKANILRVYPRKVAYQFIKGKRFKLIPSGLV